MNQSYFNRQETESSAALFAANPSVAQAATEPQRFAISLYRNVRDNLPKQQSIDWDGFCDRYFNHHDTAFDKKAAPCWSPASYPSDAIRRDEFVKSISFAVFDVEHHGVFDDYRGMLAGYAYVAHSSFRNTADDPRFRIVIPLKKPVEPGLWSNVWNRLNHWAGGINDPATSDLSRIYLLPFCPGNQEEHFIEVGEGRCLDINELPELPDELVPATPKPSTRNLSRSKIEGIEEAPPDPLNPAEGLARVVQRCSFMQWASAPENQGNISYGLWMAMVSNASRFEDAESWIHQASCEYPTYSKGQTERMIQGCRNFGIPITCQRIQSGGFEGCPSGGCKKYSGDATKAPAGLWLGAAVVATDPVVELPESERRIGSFVLNREGVFKVKFKDGEEFRTKISSYIDVVAQTFDSGSPNWGLLLNVRDPDGECHEWAMPREMLTSSNQWQAQLLKLGANVYQPGKSNDLYEYLLDANPSARALCVNQPGWHNGAFVLPSRVVGDTRGDRIVLQTSDVSGVETFKPNGSLVEWQENVGRLCVGNSRLVFAVCAALAGPTLLLLGEENGGFHFVGASSRGKTTAVEVAASVWGHRNKFVRNWRTTGNATEGLASKHNDTLLILDEISQVSANEAGEIAYMLGNGRGKSRANKLGDVRSSTCWRLIYLSTGEQSLAECMQAGNKRTMAGQEVRLVNIPADAGTGLGLFEELHGMPSGQQFSTELKRVTGEFFGEVGPAFVEALADAEGQEKLVASIRSVAKDFVQRNVPAYSCGQVSRVGNRFALLAGVGEAAIDLGILPWPKGEAVAASRSCFQSWIDSRGGTGDHETEQALNQVRRFLEIHGDSRFTYWDEGHIEYGQTRTLNRAGFRCLTNDGRQEFYVLPEAFKSEVCAGLNSREVTKALRNGGFLVLGTDGKSVRQERLPGLGSTKVYRISPDLLGGS